MPSELAPIVRQTLNQSVYAELRRALINGSLHSGQVLGIVELARNLGTSTMPVREALARLVAEKALEAMPNRSVRVPLITIERLDDLLRARLLIEGMAVELAAANITSWEIQRLQTFVAEGDGEEGSADEASLRNQQFHFMVYQAARSDVLLTIIESLWLQSGPILWEARCSFQSTPQLTGDKHHRELAEAIARRDPMKARAALAADIGRAFTLLRQREADAAVEKSKSGRKRTK
jgi:DNA-binding GntR family transcriptional regulator